MALCNVGLNLYLLVSLDISGNTDDNLRLATAVGK